MMSATARARMGALIVSCACLPPASAQTMEIVSGAGRFVDVPGTSVPVAPNSEAHLAWSPDGRLYLADRASKLLRFDPATGTATALAANGSDAGFRLGYTTGIAFDFNEAFHVATNNRLLLVDPDAGTTTDVGPFYRVEQMTFGPDGTAYFVSDGYKVYARLPSSALTVIAGFTEGFSGDGGPAVNAQLTSARGVALGPDGNLYICDFGNHRIRRIDLTTGIIDTVVGPYNFFDPRNPTLPVTLLVPRALSFDPAGNMVIALGDQRIVRIDAASEQVVLLAGNGYGNGGDGGLAINAQINEPHMLTFDANGNLYFVDYSITFGNYQHVRRVDAATGVITRVLGNNDGYFCGEGVPARSACFGQAYGLDVDAAQNLLIGDSATKRVRRISASTNQISTVATAGSLSSGRNVNGIEHDAAGNIYFAQSLASGNQINRIDAITGAIARVAGTGINGFSGDGGWAFNANLNAPADVAVDASGNLYIADNGNGRIRKVTAATKFISTYATFTAPETVEIDPAGHLVVAGATCRIVRINKDTKVATNVAGTGACAAQDPPGGTLANATPIKSGAAFAIDPAGNIFLAWSGILYRIDAATGILSQVPAPGGRFTTADGVQFTRPVRMEFDSAGRLYLTDYQKPYVFRISGLVDSTVPNLAGNAATFTAPPVNIHRTLN